jgi:hypothetical protein
VNVKIRGLFVVHGADLHSHDQSTVSAMEYILLLPLHQKWILCPFQDGQKARKVNQTIHQGTGNQPTSTKMFPFQVIIYSQNKLLTSEL